MAEQPAFEIHSGGYVMAIFAEGRVELWEGDDRLPRDAQIIVNRIPQLLAKAARGERLSAFAGLG